MTRLSTSDLQPLEQNLANAITQRPWRLRLPTDFDEPLIVVDDGPAQDYYSVCSPVASIGSGDEQDRDVRDGELIVGAVNNLENLLDTIHIQAEEITRRDSVIDLLKNQLGDPSPWLIASVEALLDGEPTPLATADGREVSR